VGDKVGSRVRRHSQGTGTDGDVRARNANQLDH
jgi:hypothetical protein